MKIAFHQVTVQMPTGLTALQEVSCAWDSKDGAVAVLGANGAGKSTLFGVVLGLVPIASGKVCVDDVVVEKRTFPQIRRRVGMIFQNPDDQLFCQTVREDISFGPMQLQLADDEVARRTDAALEQMGIVELAGRDVIRLSGGEKRRVALAGVLAMRPEAILLDEPTAMLDPRGCRELADSLNAIDSLKVIATHDLNFVRKTCSRCLVLSKGRVCAAGTVDEVLKNESLLLSSGLL